MQSSQGPFTLLDRIPAPTGVSRTHQLQDNSVIFGSALGAELHDLSTTNKKPPRFLTKDRIWFWSAVSHDESTFFYLAAPAYTNVVAVSIATGEVQCTSPTFDDTCTAMEAGPTGVIVGDATGTVRRLDPATLQVMHIVSVGNASSVLGISFSFGPGGGVISVGHKNSVYLLDATTLEQRRCIHFSDTVLCTSSCFSPPDNTLLACAGDGVLKVFDLNTGELVADFSGAHGTKVGHRAFFWACFYTPTLLITSGADEHLRVHDVRTKRQLGALHSSGFYASVSPGQAPRRIMVPVPAAGAVAQVQVKQPVVLDEGLVAAAGRVRTLARALPRAKALPPDVGQIVEACENQFLGVDQRPALEKVNSLSVVDTCRESYRIWRTIHPDVDVARIGQSEEEIVAVLFLNDSVEALLPMDPVLYPETVALLRQGISSLRTPLHLRPQVEMLLRCPSQAISARQDAETVARNNPKTAEGCCLIQ